jgi:Na+-transporting NADH:ubiquinone oxidoreductase subunit NqrD
VKGVSGIDRSAEPVAGGLEAESEPELTVTVWSLSRAVFVALLIGEALVLAGFGAAARRAGAIPGWLAGLGFGAAATGVTSNLFISETLDEGWSSPLELLTFLRDDPN